MGYQSGGQCYGTVAEATAARYASAPVYVGAGTLSVLEPSGAGWVLNVYAGSPLVLASSSVVPAATFESCSPGQAFEDGALVGWAIGAVWLAVYAVKYLATAFRYDESHSA